MASQYAHTINEKRYKLIDELVVKLLQVERGHENFELARDFCVQKAWFNSFPDVNPRETEELYASLVARLEADSQVTKASALSALTNKLLALKLTSTAGVQDLNHNLLQLLASLSDNPLSSRLNLTQDVLDLLYNPADRLAAEAQQQQQQQQGQEVVEQPAGNAHFQRLLRGSAVVRHDADSAASSDDYDPYGDDSSLSDWGNADSTQQQLQRQQWDLQGDKETEHAPEEPEQPEEQQQQLAPPEGVPGQTKAQVAHVPAAAYASRTVADQLPYGCVMPAPGQPLLKLKALQSQSGGAPNAAQYPQLQQQLCLSEHFLAQQVLRVLQGLPAQGFRIICPVEDQAQEPHGLSAPQPGSRSVGAGADSTANGTSGTSSSWSCEQYFKVDTRVSTPHMPSCALHAVLSEAAAAGTCSRQMRALIQQLAYSSLIGSRVEVTPCLRALGVALQQQLDSLGMQLADLQQQLQQERTQRTNAITSSSSSQPQQQQQQGERGLFMRYFLREARPIVRRLKLLHSTAFGILRGLHGPPAAVSAGLIDGLAAAVQAASCEQAPCPQAVAGAAALLHLLLSSCVPLSRALAQWLWCAEDTLTAPGKWERNGRSVCSSDFFIVRTAEEDVPAVHPSFWHNAYSFSRQVSASNDDHNHADGMHARAAAAGAGKGAAAAAAAPISCPAVLAPFAHSILTAGKSMRLLDYMDQEDLKRSSLCSGSGVSALGLQAPGLGAAAGAAHGTQQQGASSRLWSAAAGGGGAVQQRQPGTPRRHRPSSCGGRVNSSSTAGAGAGGGGGTLAGRLTRQPSWSGRPGSSRPASAGPAALGQGQAAAANRGGSRRKWDAPQQPALAVPSAAAAAGAGAGGPAVAPVYGVDRSAVARRVELQLAAAAAVAGQQLVENELPHEFIGSVNYVLQQEQELQAKAHVTMQQHQQYLQSCIGDTLCSGSSSSSSSATELLLQRLEAVAASLAKPNDLAAAGAAIGGQLSVREALWAARKAREAGAGAALLHEAPHAGQDTTALQHLLLQQSPAESGPEVAAVPGTTFSTAASSSSSSSAQQLEGCAAGSPIKEPESPAAPEPQTPPKAAGPTAAAGSPTECFAVQLAEPEAAAVQAGATAEVAAGQASSSNSSSPDVVPKLTVWKDQMDAKLTAAHQHLQRMAPWQQHVPADDSSQDTCKQTDNQQQQSGSKATHNRATTTTSSSRSSKNWLLQTADTKVPGQFTGSLAELWPLKPVRGLKELAASGASWLQGAAWPGCDLEWLLHDPPGHLPAVQQLLWSALVQPVRTRVELVDRQLMSSLMGEWGMLQQLQGLANAFLISSPSMVEWVDALFTAVETHWKTRPVSSSLHSRHGGDCSTPTSTGKTTPRVGGAGGYESPGVYVGSPGAGGLPGTGGQTPVTVEDLDFSSLEALLQDCLLSADPDEVLPDPTTLLITLNKAAINSLRDDQQRKLRAFAEAGPAAAARQQAAVGLMLCSKEWTGLELQHTGSWQLSLVYNDEQLRFFGQAWRVMLQLRWVRRRVGGQAVAHRISASVNNLTARDRLEAAQVAAAFGSGSRTRPHSAGSYGQQATAAAVLDWLSGKEELLLLQEMTHFLSCWHSYVMDGIRVKAWNTLEEVLMSAKSLDQVHSATRTFFHDMCSFCNLWPPTLQRTRKAKMTDTTRHQIEELMDHALAAAAAAGRVFAARHKLLELQGAPGREGDMQAWWMELAEARSRLRQAGRMWQKALSDMLQFWTLMKKHNVSHAFEELPALLDMNGYFSRVQDAARS